uniref:G-protein coupled receptors family 2 profile 2 domain-containing protein n=1 Tax=Spermophilus dauricus TaxID=99837 RepID=A0A8C9P3M3_SPEDA
MANFYWLLVEGLYLHTLLVAILPPSRCFLAYLLIGWGIPTICIGAWTATRLSLEDTGCWDTNEHSVPWWVIRMPILVSILVNFILFISIIRILLQKLMSPDVGGNDQSQYKRLAKSTLLLIPLFGVHYVVFAAFPIGISAKYQILLELCGGSFQVGAPGRRGWAAAPTAPGDPSLPPARGGVRGQLPRHQETPVSRQPGVGLGGSSHGTRRPQSPASPGWG